MFEIKKKKRIKYFYHLIHKFVVVLEHFLLYHNDSFSMEHDKLIQMHIYLLVI